jgi:hypothetical protein
MSKANKVTRPLRRPSLGGKGQRSGKNNSDVLNLCDKVKNCNRIFKLGCERKRRINSALEPYNDQK